MKLKKLFIIFISFSILFSITACATDTKRNHDADKSSDKLSSANEENFTVPKKSENILPDIG